MRSGAPLAEIGLAIDRLAAEDLDALPTTALGTDLVDLSRLSDRLHAEHARRLARFDSSQGYAPSGALSSASWLRHNCRLSGGVAAQRVQVARELQELPQTAAAFASGELGFQHVQVITRAAAELGSERLRDAEGILVDAARQLDPGQLVQVTNHLRLCLDPDGTLSAVNRDHDRRRVHLSQSLDGMYVLDGLLDPEGGACLKKALEAIAGPRRKGDGRSPAQVRADAIVELGRIHLDKGDLPKVGGQRPHLTLTTSLATLTGQPGAQPAEVEGVGPVPTETARRLACDPALTVLTLGEDGRPLWAGHATRVISGSLRRALVARDRGCRFPGCDRPASWADGHHVQHWADGGETSLDNVMLLCRPHHRRVHEEGWRLVAKGPAGELQAVPP